MASEVAHRTTARWGPVSEIRHAAWTSVVWFVAAYAALSATMIVAGLALTHGPLSVSAWDRHADVWMFEHRTTFLNGLSSGGTFLANTLGVLAVAAIVTVCTVVRRCGLLIALVPVGLALEIVVFLTANYAVQRPRPAVPHLGSTPSTYSFPSGHVAATLVLYGAVAVLVSMHTENRAARVAVWCAAVLLPLWVGFSRVYEGQHNPFDVLAGLGLGFAVLCVTVTALSSSRVGLRR